MSKFLSVIVLSLMSVSAFAGNLECASGRSSEQNEEGLFFVSCTSKAQNISVEIGYGSLHKYAQGNYLFYPGILNNNACQKSENLRARVYLADGSREILSLTNNNLNVKTYKLNGAKMIMSRILFSSDNLVNLSSDNGSIHLAATEEISKDSGEYLRVFDLTYTTADANTQTAKVSCSVEYRD